VRIRIRVHGIVAVIGALVFLFSAAAGYAQESSALGGELVQLLTESQLDAIAAKDSEGADRFVAAFFPGQLIVVSARYEVTMYVEEKIRSGDFREVYLDLIWCVDS